MECLVGAGRSAVRAGRPAVSPNGVLCCFHLAVSRLLYEWLGSQNKGRKVLMASYQSEHWGWLDVKYIERYFIRKVLAVLVVQILINGLFPIKCSVSLNQMSCRDYSYILWKSALYSQSPKSKHHRVNVPEFNFRLLSFKCCIIVHLNNSLIEFLKELSIKCVSFIAVMYGMDGNGPDQSCSMLISVSVQWQHVELFSKYYSQAGHLGPAKSLLSHGYMGDRVENVEKADLDCAGM